MTDNEAKFDLQKRVGVERRSRVDTRPEEERQLLGERRSQIDRRMSRSPQQPSNEQLALFAKRVRRAIRDEGARHNSVHPRPRAISGAIPTYFGHWSGLKALRILDKPNSMDGTKLQKIQNRCRRLGNLATRSNAPERDARCEISRRPWI